MIGSFSSLGRGFGPVALWDSISTPAREEAEAAICARLRAGWRPAALAGAFDDLADDLEHLVREDWDPRRSVRYAGGAATGTPAIRWDGVRRTRAVPA